MLATLLLLAGCGGSDGPEATTDVGDLAMPDQIVTNSETYLTESGRRTGVIRSDTAKTYESRDTTLLYGVEVDFFDSSGAHILTLESDSGRVTRKATIFDATGNVRAWTDDGRRLSTDSLRWDAATGMVTTEGYVEAYRDGVELSGWGLETDQHLESIIIKRDSRGSFSEPDAQDN